MKEENQIRCNSLAEGELRRSITGQLQEFKKRLQSCKWENNNNNNNK